MNIRPFLFALLLAALVGLAGPEIASAQAEMVGPPAPTKKTAVDADKALVDRFRRDLIYLRQNYPIESLRLRFEEICQRRDRDEIDIIVTTGSSPSGEGALAQSYVVIDKDRLIIQFFLAELRRCYQEMPLSIVSDIVVSTILYQAYYLDHHDFSMGAEPTRDEESETWWWTVETVYLPMEQHGHLSGLPADDTMRQALEAYRLAAGDPNHAAWQVFVETMMAPEDGPTSRSDADRSF